ncbi:MAG: hypothetical protein DRI23_05780 [Candidatus Cloacimonadota bacterium]|nr:MAG: hypothetical protein DRI23_05780 [Candidatus Cloacimonadota bacterium]
MFFAAHYISQLIVKINVRKCWRSDKIINKCPIMLTILLNRITTNSFHFTTLLLIYNKKMRIR